MNHAAAVLLCLIAPVAVRAGPVALPAKLIAATGGGAAGYDFADVSAEATGLVDRSDSAALRVAKSAFDAATNDDERLALLSMSL